MSKLLIPEPPLQLLPSLAVKIGMNEAIFIQQLHYWALRSEDGWVYNTYEQWREQFPFWSIRTIQRIVRNLEEASLIISRQDNAIDRKKYYQIAYDNLDELDPPKTSDCHVRTRQDDALLINREYINIDSDLQSDEMGIEEPAKSKGRTRKPKRSAEEIRPMANAIASATNLKYADNFSIINKISNDLLDGGYTPEKVAGFSAWWRSNDWRGKRGQPPTPWQLKSMIGMLEKQAENKPDDEKYKRFLEQLKGDEE